MTLEEKYKAYIKKQKEAEQRRTQLQAELDAYTKQYEEKKKAILSVSKTSSTTNHLCEKGVTFRWAEHDDAINRWLVKAFSQEHGIADDVQLAIMEFLDNICTVGAVCMNFGRSKPACI